MPTATMRLLAHVGDPMGRTQTLRVSVGLLWWGDGPAGEDPLRELT
ncbi:hypothetical protein NGF75_08400 [Dietzia kunjamensis]|nr:hypothetical protein [Dietzia kunjamensis]MEB8326007.1 hypothetical protein [Dietzia kunjamensis]